MVLFFKTVCFKIISKNTGRERKLFFITFRVCETDNLLQLFLLADAFHASKLYFNTKLIIIYKHALKKKKSTKFLESVSATSPIHSAKNQVPILLCTYQYCHLHQTAIVPWFIPIQFNAIFIRII